MANIKQDNDKKRNNLGIWENLRSKFDTGNGLVVSITSKKGENDKNGVVSLFYTNKAPKLKIRGYEIDVEYASSEKNDEDLLHFLANGL